MIPAKRLTRAPQPKVGPIPITLYHSPARLTFDAFPHANEFRVTVPSGSAVKPVRGEPLLFVPADAQTSYAWTARDVLVAAWSSKSGFDFIEAISAADVALHAKVERSALKQLSRSKNGKPVRKAVAGS